MNIAQLLEERKWLVIRLLMGLSLILLLVGLVLPVTTETIGRWRQARQIAAKVDEARSYREVTNRLRDENANIERRLRRLRQEVPEEAFLSAIVGAIQTWAKEAGIGIEYLKPQPAVRPEASGYHDIAIELGMAGRYHQLGKFLNSLETSEYVVRVRSLELTAEDLLSHDLNITLEISVFMMAKERQKTDETKQNPEDRS